MKSDNYSQLQHYFARPLLTAYYFCGIQQMRLLGSFSTLPSGFCRVSKHKVVGLLNDPLQNNKKTFDLFQGGYSVHRVCMSGLKGSCVKGGKERVLRLDANATGPWCWILDRLIPRWESILSTPPLP